MIIRQIEDYGRVVLILGVNSESAFSRSTIYSKSRVPLNKGNSSDCARRGTGEKPLGGRLFLPFGKARGSL